MRNIFILILLLPQFGLSLTLNERLSDLNQLKQIIAEDYGPLELKEKKLPLNLEALSQSFENKIQNAKTDEEFKYLLLQYVAQFRDSHFSLRLPQQGQMQLGFLTDYIEGKVLIEEVDRKILSKTQFPFDRGDEVVSFNGQPVGQTINEIQKHIGMSSALAARNLAVYSLAYRDSKRMPLPQGHTVVGIKKAGTQNVTEVTLPWIFIAPPKPANLNINRYKAASIGPIGQGHWCSEKSRIVPPVGSEIINDVPFTAFSFPTSKGKVGFIRIPHFNPFNKVTGKDESKLRFSQYDQVIRKFENETIGLIIDQDFNCGGSIIYAYKLLSLFIRHPFQPSEFSFRTSQGQIDGLSRHLNNFSPEADGYQLFRNLIEKIKDDQYRGKKMTDKIPVFGVMEFDLPLPVKDNKVLPHPYGYTKPIVLLINEMSGSGGDLFPAVMQDNRRAYLLGSTTMGAAGHNWNDPELVLKNSKIPVNITRSLFYRKDGSAIENTGVIPHMKYQISETDFMNGYSTYLENAVMKLPVRQ